MKYFKSGPMIISASTSGLVAGMELDEINPSDYNQIVKNSVAKLGAVDQAEDKELVGKLASLLTGRFQIFSTNPFYNLTENAVSALLERPFFEQHNIKSKSTNDDGTINIAYHDLRLEIDQKRPTERNVRRAKPADYVFTGEAFRRANEDEVAEINKQKTIERRRQAGMDRLVESGILTRNQVNALFEVD